MKVREEYAFQSIPEKSAVEHEELRTAQERKMPYSLAKSKWSRAHLHKTSAIVSALLGLYLDSIQLRQASYKLPRNPRE